jgi:hypothetical protein
LTVEEGREEWQGRRLGEGGAGRRETSAEPWRARRSRGGEGDKGERKYRRLGDRSSRSRPLDRLGVLVSDGKPSCQRAGSLALGQATGFINIRYTCFTTIYKIFYNLYKLNYNFLYMKAAPKCYKILSCDQPSLLTVFSQRTHPLGDTVSTCI